MCFLPIVVCVPFFDLGAGAFTTNSDVVDLPLAGSVHRAGHWALYGQDEEGGDRRGLVQGSPRACHRRQRRGLCVMSILGKFTVDV